MNEQCMTGEDLHSFLLLLHLPDVLVHVARGGSHVLSAWHWLRGLPSRVYPSLHSKVTLSRNRNSCLMSNSFQIPFVNFGRLHFTSEIRKLEGNWYFIENFSCNYHNGKTYDSPPPNLFPFSKEGSCFQSRKLDSPSLNIVWFKINIVWFKILKLYFPRNMECTVIHF